MISVLIEIVGDVRQVGIATLKVLRTTERDDIVRCGMEDIERCLRDPGRTDAIAYDTRASQAFVQAFALRMVLIPAGGFEPMLETMITHLPKDFHHIIFFGSNIFLIDLLHGFSQ